MKQGLLFVATSLVAFLLLGLRAGAADPMVATAGGTAQDRPAAEASPTTREEEGWSCSTAGPLSLCLQTDKQSYYLGEPVQITLEITAMERVSGWYPSSCTSDFWVELGPGLELWRLLNGMACATVILPFELEAGETLAYQVTWDQRDNLDRQVPPGNYSARGQGLFCLGPSMPFCGPTSAPAPFRITECVSCGDANSDGKVSMVDAMLIAQCVVGLVDCAEIDPERADVNCDGKVTMEDAMLIAQKVVGLIDEFPCTPPPPTPTP